MHLPALRDNFANCKANTCKKNLVLSKRGDELCLSSCSAGCASPKQKPTPFSAADTVEAGECRESVRKNALLDEFTTYQVEGSIVDYLALDG